MEQPLCLGRRDELELGEGSGCFLLLGYALVELIWKVNSSVRYKW